MSVLDLLAEDNDLIPYRKSLREIAGSVTATILLQQMIHRAKQKDWEPFYKFKAPCNHELYKLGDSWTEELGFSKSEFDSALNQIGTKITKGTKKADAYAGTKPQNIIIYWTDASRVTWYHINYDLLDKLTKSIYLEDQQSQLTYKVGKIDLSSLTESPSESPTESPFKSSTNVEDAAKKSSPKTNGQDNPIKAKTEDGEISPPKPKKSPTTPIPEAIKIYQQYARTYPNKSIWADIVEAVGDKQIDLDFWGVVVHNYILCGWYKGSIKTMLGYFERREVPGDSKPNDKPNGNGANNGSYQKTSPSTLDEQPYLDIYTSEYVYPDGRRTKTLMS